MHGLRKAPNPLEVNWRGLGGSAERAVFLEREPAGS